MNTRKLTVYCLYCWTVEPAHPISCRYDNSFAVIGWWNSYLSVM